MTNTRSPDDVRSLLAEDSAGKNRQYVGGESPLQIRRSQPVWLRVMGRRE